MVDWVVSRRVNESCCAGSLTQRGPSWVVLFNKKPFEASSCPCVTCLSDVGGEVDCLPMVKPDADSHLGIRHVCTCTFKVSSEVGSPHWRWVTFVPVRERGISLGTCENGKRGDAICGFNAPTPIGKRGPLSCDGSWHGKGWWTPHCESERSVARE